MAALLSLGPTLVLAQQAPAQNAASDTEAPATGANAKKAEATKKRLADDLKKKSDSAKTEDSEGKEKDVIEMSPFVVNSENNRGYEATSAMSGSRLNTKLDDIAASVSVVTKEQLTDFAATDINDIFAMEVGTEGTRTYTANGSDGRGDVDAVAQNPNSANRIRGLGSANMAVGNFAMSNQVAIDTYNIDAVEISRGSNSSIFGVSEGGGTVNLIPATANLSKSKTSLGTSYSSYGTIRSTIDVGRPIIKDMLAVRVIGLAENKGYRREPAYDKTRRINLLVQFRPFKGTTIRASYEKFKEDYSRPNSSTPTDYMSLWESAGRPSYDPTTNVWRYTNASGQVVTGTQATSNSGTTAFPSGVWLTGLGSTRVRGTMWVDQGKVDFFSPTFWTEPTAFGADSKPTAGTNREIVVFGTPVNWGVPAQYVGGIGYTAVPASTNKSFYDYTDINLAALNSGYKRAEYSRVELEQYFINTDRHILATLVGLQKEQINDVSRNFVGSGGDGISLTILPDVNEKYPDGTPNPHFGAPYIGALSPQVFRRPLVNTTAKTNVAYQLDLSKERNFLRWFGRHRLLGYAEYNQRQFSPNGLRYHDQISTNFTDRIVPARNGNSTWQMAPIGASNNGAQFFTHYYLGDSSGGNVDYASAAPNYGNGLVYRRWGSLNTDVRNNRWYSENVDVDSVYFSQGTQQVQTRTKGYVYQGFFLGERIIPTYGERKDKIRSRDNIAQPAGATDYNGFVTDESFLWEYAGSPWLVRDKATQAREISGKTRTKGIVVKPFTWLSLRYNQSNSFYPMDYGIDLENNPVPNPNGKTKDYGFSLNLFKNKLVLRVTRFESFTKDARGNISTTANRITNMDFDIDPATNGSHFDLEDWLTGQFALVDGFDSTANGTAEQQARWLNQAHSYMKMDQSFIDMQRLYSSSRAMTSDASSKGVEVELNYNPTRYWTMKLTGGKQEAMNDNIAGSWQRYRDARLPIWQSIISPYTDPTTGTRMRYWTDLVDGGQVARDYFGSAIDAPMRLNYALQGKPVPQNRKYKFNYMTNFRLSGITSHHIWKNVSVGGRVSWEDRGSIGFLGGEPDSDGIVRQYDANRPVWDSSHKYVDLFTGYDFRMWRDRVRARVQLNVRNVFEDGRLQAYEANPDGTPRRFRIIDPREFILSVNFDI